MESRTHDRISCFSTYVYFLFDILFIFHFSMYAMMGCFRVVRYCVTGHVFVCTLRVTWFSKWKKRVLLFGRFIQYLSLCVSFSTSQIFICWEPYFLDITATSSAIVIWGILIDLILTSVSHSSNWSRSGFLTWYFMSAVFTSHDIYLLLTSAKCSAPS